MKLNKEELRLAAQVCFRSAEELLADAQLLLLMNRFARAVFIAAIGLEELGKAALSLHLHDFGIEPDLNEFLMFWRHHESKLAHGHGFWPFDPVKLQEIAPEIVPERYKDWVEYDRKKRQFYSELARLTSHIKMGALYVDIRKSSAHQKIRISLPSQAIRKDHAKKFVTDLEQKLRNLQAEIQALGPLLIPAYDVGEIYDPSGT